MNPRELSTVPPPLCGLHLLVVDDNNDGREILTIALEVRGARVTAVDSALAALAALDENAADVLVSDISMPHEDGYALLTQVRARASERGGHIPAIAVTGLSGPADRAKALAAGFNAYLVKPIEIDELTTTITALTAP